MGNHRVGTTAKSGYIQRRIIKCCEDIQVQYDGTVRDTTGNVYQMTYGDNGFDPCSTVKVGNSQEACDISRIIACANLQYEMQLEEVKTTENNTIKTTENNTIKTNKPTENNTNNTNKPTVSRISLLKELAKISGVKRLYKGWSVEELTQRIEGMLIEKSFK